MKAKGSFLIKSPDDLKCIPKSIPRGELMLQEYIKAKYEYKVITVSYRTLPVVLRFNTKYKGFRPNFSTARAMPIHRLSLRIIKTAERASKTLARQLAKVDILEDHRGKLFVLEVNRFPGLGSFEKLTGFNVAKEFVRYLKI